jgi:uncharacterized protein (TIGR00369 family)
MPAAESSPPGEAEQAAPESRAPDGAELIAAFLEHSPFVRHLGIRLELIEPDRAVLAMPFAEPLVTIGDVVHGGAISSLIDTAAMTAAWSAAQVPEQPRGTTVGLTVHFLAPARSRPLAADARVIRRGSSLCFCEVDVADGGGNPVAKGLVTYKLG